MRQGTCVMNETTVTETRERTRFNMLVSLDALFAGQAAIVRNLSAGGIGLRHPAQVRVRSTGSVRIDAPENDGATPIPCRVVWSRLSRICDDRGKHFYDSGLQILDDSPAVAGLLGRLIRAYGVKDAESLDAKRLMLEARARDRASAPLLAAAPAPATIPRITPDQVLLIREAQEILTSNPDAATKWLDRAKRSLIAKGLITPDAKSSPHRRDVLVIWEYLGGTLDLEVVSMITGLKAQG